MKRFITVSAVLLLAAVALADTPYRRNQYQLDQNIDQRVTTAHDYAPDFQARAWARTEASQAPAESQTIDNPFVTYGTAKVPARDVWMVTGEIKTPSGKTVRDYNVFDTEENARAAPWQPGLKVKNKAIFPLPVVGGDESSPLFPNVSTKIGSVWVVYKIETFKDKTKDAFVNVIGVFSVQSWADAAIEKEKTKEGDAKVYATQVPLNKR